MPPQPSTGIGGTPGAPVWQRSFHDPIIRDPRDLDRHRRDIALASGGRTGIGRTVRSDIDLALAIEAGLIPEAVDAVRQVMALTDDEFERLLLPRRTLRYRRAHEQPLKPDESDRVARLARVWVWAAETFGDESKARTWLRRPNRALKGRAPLDLMDTGSGAIVVEQVLTRIAYGSFE